MTNQTVNGEKRQTKKKANRVTPIKGELATHFEFIFSVSTKIKARDVSRVLQSERYDPRELLFLLPTGKGCQAGL